MHNIQIPRGAQKKRTPRIALDKEVDDIVVTHDAAINTCGRTSSLNDMPSLDANQAAAPRGNCSKHFFHISVQSDKGLDLVVDLNTKPFKWIDKNYSLFHTGYDEHPVVASKEPFKIQDILKEAQLKASVKNKRVNEMVMKEGIGCGDKSPVAGGTRLKTQIENEKAGKVVAEEHIDYGAKSSVHEGSQVTPESDKHETTMRTEPLGGVPMKEGVGCGDMLPDYCQMATDFSLVGLTPSSLASGGMSADGGGNEAVVEEEVVHMEDAVKLLVERLVRPELPRHVAQDACHMTLEKQRAVAQQVHTAIILYNYYYRKRCPQLAFADAKQFFICASLSVGEDLLPYLSIVHARENNSGNEVSLSLTDREAIQACAIAAELGASHRYPDVGMWPIAKVAVLLLDPTRKKCLIEYGADTKDVWSFIEKEFDAAAGISHTTNQPIGQESTNRKTSGVLNGQFMLQQLAISEVQHRTGMEASDLLVLDDTLAYSLSKQRTTTKLFMVEYRQTMKGKFVEMSLEELINSMTGPVLVNDPSPKITSVVDYYHILPYKEILEGLLQRKWPAVPQHGLHSVIDEKLEEQDENIMSKMQKQIRRVSTPKQNKPAIKATGANSNQNSSISKHKKSRKRKTEASRVTTAEGPDGESPIIENGSLIVPDVETSGLMTKSINTQATATLSGRHIALHSSGQVEKIETQKQPIYDNMPPDVFPTKQRYVDPAIKDGALECQNVEVMENSGGATANNIDQMYELLQSIQKIRDDTLHKECILQERSIQCDMDIQTILNEGEMTPKVLSIGEKYKGTCSNMMEVANSSFSGDGGQTRSSKRKTLKEALLLTNNKCHELDKICNEGKWILPRYTIVPSVADGMFHASVRFTCPYFDMSIAGDPSPTPHEARCSAAANMIVELEKKSMEEE